jgi:hypothetical protein
MSKYKKNKIKNTKKLKNIKIHKNLKNKNPK